MAPLLDFFPDLAPHPTSNTETAVSTPQSVSHDDLFEDTSPVFRFLDLPRALRDKVYKYALSNETVYIQNGRSEIGFRVLRSPFLLYTSRKIREEGVRFLLQCTFCINEEPFRSMGDGHQCHCNNVLMGLRVELPRQIGYPAFHRIKRVELVIGSFDLHEFLGEALAHVRHVFDNFPADFLNSRKTTATLTFRTKLAVEESMSFTRGSVYEVAAPLASVVKRQRALHRAIMRATRPVSLRNALNKIYQLREEGLRMLAGEFATLV